MTRKGFRESGDGLVMSRERVTWQKVHDGGGGVLNRRRTVTRKEKRGKDFMAVVNERKCMEEKEHKLGKMTAAKPNGEKRPEGQFQSVMLDAICSRSPENRD